MLAFIDSLLLMNCREDISQETSLYWYLISYTKMWGGVDPET